MSMYDCVRLLAPMDIALIRHNLFPNRLSETEGHYVLLMAHCIILNQPPYISFNNARQNSAQHRLDKRAQLYKAK